MVKQKPLVLCDLQEKDLLYVETTRAARMVLYRHAAIDLRHHHSGSWNYPVFASRSCRAGKQSSEPLGRRTAHRTGRFLYAAFPPAAAAQSITAGER